MLCLDKGVKNLKQTLSAISTDFKVFKLKIEGVAACAGLSSQLYILWSILFIKDALDKV